MKDKFIHFTNRFENHLENFTNIFLCQICLLIIILQKPFCLKLTSQIILAKQSYHYIFLIFLKRRMVSFTFQGLFDTTNRGIPNTSNLPPSTTMNRNYYTCSILLQAIIMLLFILYFVLSIFRVVKKIKNSKFQDVPDQEKKEEEEHNRKEGDVKNQQEEDANQENQKDQNLIYRFDEDEEEEGEEKKEQEAQQGEIQKIDETIKIEKQEKTEKKMEEKEESVTQDYNSYHDVYEESYIRLDQKLLFLQPFLISFIVSNNIFQSNALSLVSLSLMLVSYVLFNIKGLLGHLRIVPMVFMIFSLMGYIPFFIGDHDVST